MIAILLGLLSVYNLGRQPIRRVVLVTIDTLRADHLGAYGYSRNTSPFLDSLAQRGILFEQARSQSSHTLPSHASLFTSLYPFQHRARVNGQRLRSDILTLAGLLSEHEVTTAAFTSVKFLRGVQNGFEVFDAKSRRADETIDQTIKWLEDQSSDRRFLLWIHLYDVHQYHSLKKVNKVAVDQVTLKEPQERQAFLDFLYQKHHIPRDAFNQRRLMRTYTGYDGQLRYVDQQLQRLFEWMGKRGLQDSSLWIITADHGEGLGNHYYTGHGKYIYNEQLHVPMIWYFSDARYPVKRIPHQVQLVDIFPSVTDIFDITLTNGAQKIQGTSLVPLLQQDEVASFPKLSFAQRRPRPRRRRSWEREVWEAGTIASLQSLHHKYILHSQGQDEFYDLTQDPYETNNLIEAEDNVVISPRESLKKSLAHMLRNQKRPQARQRPQKIDKDIHRELRSLGYLQ